MFAPLHYLKIQDKPLICNHESSKVNSNLNLLNKKDIHFFLNGDDLCSSSGGFAYNIGQGHNGNWEVYNSFLSSCITIECMRFINHQLR